MSEEDGPRGGIGQSTMDLAADLAHLHASADLTARFQVFAENLGFSELSCFKVPDPGEPLEQCMHMCTRPKAWIEHYSSQGYVAVDPIVQEVFRSTRAYQWSDILKRPTVPAIAHQIQNERLEFGYSDGLVVPIYETKGYAGLVVLAGEGEVTPQVKATLTIASVFVHNRLVTVGRQRLLPDDLLTIREIECLNWAAEGKSDWEIGQILKISSKTVNYHIENVKRKYRVPTRVQAIVYAFRHGKLG